MIVCIDHSCVQLFVAVCAGDSAP